MTREQIEAVKRLVKCRDGGGWDTGRVYAYRRDGSLWIRDMGIVTAAIIEAGSNEELFAIIKALGVEVH